tara:strand:+ start:38 stop:505 length:468 start_codon:yes stop_codon:yes gene_type:complete
MDLFTYIGSLIISYLSIPVGLFLAYHTKEEMPHFHHAFHVLREIIFIALLITLYFTTANSFTQIGYVIVAIIFLFLLTKEHVDKYLYPVLGILFYLSAFSDAFLLAASFIFLYGIPTGSLYFIEHHSRKHLYQRLIKEASVFAIIALLLYLLLGF